MSRKREKCDCPECFMTYDPACRNYMPYCNFYHVWLDYDRRYSLDEITESAAYRLEICFVHGRPEKGGTMKVIEQSWSWVQIPAPLEMIEIAGRTCYKSESHITPESAAEFTRMILKRGHESVIEHASATVRFITNRGVTHELVRHRLAAYSQESTRYVNYGGKEMQFIKPVWVTRPSDAYDTWRNAMMKAEEQYNQLLAYGWRPEQAREVLPNSLKTEIVMTANLREWRHVFRLRTAKAAHPQMRALMQSCLYGFKEGVPVIFDDINPFK